MFLIRRLSPLSLYVLLGNLAAVSGISALVWFLFNNSWPFWNTFGPESLWGVEWYPYESLYGFLPAILGTTWALIIAMLIAIPCALSAAIVSSELLPRAWQTWMRLSMEILAGIPSVVYGLIGLWVLLPFLQEHLNLLTGHSLLAAGIILSLMILPTIMLMAQDALQAVHQEQREAASSLGLDWNQRLCRVLLPQAWPGIRSGILLSLGRGLGETMAVMLVVGSLDRVPQPFYNILEPAQTLTSRIGREMGEAAFGSMHFSALIACGLTLAVVAVSLSLITQKHGNGSAA
ncbi:MAG: phosphate ABC transporter permease subunit PstC [Ghiorsea sp.]